MLDAIHAESIRRMVGSFYARVREDPLLGPVFGERLDGRWPEHIEKMVGFWRAALLHEPTYSGNPRAAHARLEGVGPEHFERWLDLFARTTDEIFIEEAAAVVQSRASMMARGLLSARGFPRTRLPFVASARR